MRIALGFCRRIRWIICRSLWSAASVTEQVLMIQMSAGSSFFARVCPRSISAFPSALDSAKFNLHPNVVKEIFIIWLQRYCFFLTYARKKRPEDAFSNLAVVRLIVLLSAYSPQVRAHGLGTASGVFLR